MTNCASATSRTSSCRMSKSAISRLSTTRLPPQHLAPANAGLITDIIACPGLDYCALANARSIPVAQRLSRTLRRSGPPGGDRRTEDQDFRLHQRLRPPPCRPYRHSGRRPEGRGILPDHAGRLGRRKYRHRRDRRPGLFRRRGRRRGRAASSTPISPTGTRRRKASSPPIAGSARRRSRRRFMADDRNTRSCHAATRSPVRRPLPN